MRVGSLEIEIMAGIARLQKDMNDAQRIVGDSMANVERSVASAKRAMQTLGVGLPLAAIADQVRRMTDQYTKLDAQLRLSTQTQAQYAQGMSDIRRISSIAQSDISATSMLYTRLMNVMRDTGVEQSKLATVTETVSFGLKAYGATAQEASSAALQLSQAMGANRLGGEEFRAVMEAMPNVMRVVADSMGVPLGALRQLSIDGKITADVLVKALGDPAIAAQFKAMAENTQTVTGAWVVARNELMLLVGEFGKSSGGVNIFIGAFKAMGETFALMAQYMQQLISLATVMAVLYGGRYVAAMQAAWVVTRAHTEALAMNAAGNAAHAAVVEQAKAAETVASNAASAAKLRETVAAREALFATEAEMTVKAASARATIAQTETTLAHTLGLISNTAAKEANVIAIAELAAAESALTKINKARNAAQVEAIAMDAVRTRELAAQATATAAAAAAEEARVATTLSGFAKIRAFAVSNAFGLIGLAMWGAYEIADHLGWIDKVFASAETRLKKLREDILSAREIPSQAGGKTGGTPSNFNTVPGLVEDAAKRYFESVGASVKDFKAYVQNDSFVFSKDFLSKEQEASAKATKLYADFVAELDRLWAMKGVSQENRDKAALQLRETYIQRLDELNKKDVAAAGNVHTSKMQQVLAALEAEAAAEEGKLSRVQKVSLEWQALKKKEQTLAEYALFTRQVEIAATLDEADRQAELNKQLATGQVAYQEYWTSVATSTEKLIEQAKQQEFENTLIGKTKEEIAALTAQRERDTIAKMEAIRVTMIDASTVKEIADYDALIAAKKRVREADVDKTAREAQNAARAEQLAAEKKRWEMIDGFAQTAFNNIFDKGKNVFAEIGNAIKKYVLDLLYKMTVQKWLINIGVAGGGMGAAGSALAGGMGGGGTGILGAIGSSIAGFGASVATGFGLTAEAATTAASAYSAAGMGATSLGLQLGNLAAAIPGWGWAIAGGLALLSAFGGNKGTPGTNVGAASTTFSPTGAITGQGSWAGLSPATNQAGVQSFVNMMNDSYRAAAQSLGITAASTIFSLSQNLGKDSKAPQFAIRGGTAGGSEFFSGWTPQSDAAMQLAASKAVLTALQGSELPQYLQKVFKGLKVEVMTQSDIDNTLAFATALKTARDALAETRTPLQILSDTVQASIASLGTSATTFRTDFIAAIDAGISPEKLSQWSQLGTMLDQLAQASKAATDSIASSLDSLQGGNANTLLGAQANVNMSMAAVTAAMPWITSFDQLATITMADANNYSVANQVLIANALSAGVSLKDLQKTVDPITTQIQQQQPTSPTKNIGEIIKRREQQEADILNQKLQMQAEIFKLLGDAAGAAAVLEKQHEIALKGMDASLRPLQKELWALQKAAEEAAKAQKLLTDKLSIQAQIAELTGNTTEQAAILEEQRRIALQELAKQDPTGQLGELTAHLWALQAAAQKAAAEQKLLTDKLSIQAQIAELTGNAAEKAAILQQQHQIALQELAKQDPTGQLGELTAKLWGLQAAAAAAAAAAKLQDDKLSLQAQVYALTGDKAAAAAVLEKQHAIALAALDPSLRELQKQLWGLQAAADAAAKAAAYAQTMGGLQVQLLNAQGKTAEATALERQLALKQIDDAAQRELQKQVWAAQDKAKAEADAAQAAQEAAQAQAQAAAEATRAAEQLKSAWQSVTDSIFAEVRRIRGLLGADSAGDIQARFAIATAQARAGDQEAAKLLPELSRALLDLAATNATTAQELARIQGRTVASLQTTGMALTGQYGLNIPSYDVGTPSVPFDMVAQIHKGERIVPAAANDTLVEEIRALRQEVTSLRVSSAETASATRKTSDLLRNVTQDGNSLLTTPA